MLPMLALKWSRGGIDTGAIVALPNENSDIRANSVNAWGSNIWINTLGTFDLQFRPQGIPLSDITTTRTSPALSSTVQLNEVMDCKPRPREQLV
ncbi:S-layer family protein [Leptolyngbya sp. FACHB-321]|uniref:S-layer family protein n=1 Tax=Leptolyngbya sp. FACHB-321 TaxID=2692807 RepID=UPI001689F10A|nr:S-layer family protein [Leptolyngbya sp. FACHB-321]MBD2036935.1 S-layer family protein [Leptolyngbya sp. FACHB-321]